MGKIFKDLEDLANEGGLYNIKKVDNEGSKFDTESDRTPSKPNQSQLEQRIDQPDSTSPQEFQAAQPPSEASVYKHEERDGLRPSEIDNVESIHDENTDLKPSDTSPYDHDQNIPTPESPNQNQLEQQEQENLRPPNTSPASLEDNAKEPPTESNQFDHVANNDSPTPSEIGAFDHTKDAGEPPSETNAYQHEDNENLVPSEQDAYEHEENTDLRPSDTTGYDHGENEDLRPSEDQPYQHRENQDLIPSEDAPYQHEENQDLRPNDASEYGHEENDDLRPSETSPYQHEEDEALRPSDTSQFTHEENEDLRPTDASSFEHQEDEGLTPSETSPYEHGENEDLRPSDTSEFQHQEDESLRPSDDQAYQHEEDENLRPQDTGPYQHEENEELRPQDDTSFEHVENEDLRPSDAAPYEHQEDESLRPSDDTAYQHEENEELRPTDDQSYEHQEDESLRPEDDQPYQHQENEDLRPTDDQPYEHEEDESLRPSDSEQFQHEEDETLRPTDDSPYEHQEDETLRPSDDEPYEHQEDESLRPTDDQPYDHQEDPDLRPSDADPYQHQEDPELRPEDDEAYQHQEDEDLRPKDDQPFDHVENEELRPQDAEIFEHQEDATLRPSDDETYEHQEDESLRPADDEEYDHTENAGTEPAEPNQTPLDSIAEINETTNYPNYWSVTGAVPVSPDEIDQNPLDPVYDSEVGQPAKSVWEGTLELGSRKKLENPSETNEDLQEIIELTGDGIIYDRGGGSPLVPFGLDAPATDPRRDTTDFVDVNNQIRRNQFDAFFFTVQNPPFVLIRPDSDRADQKSNDSRVYPRGATLQDQERLGKFFLSPKGLIFQAKQTALQLLNPRKRTRIYDPTALQKSAVPYVNETRHLDASENIVGSLINQVVPGKPVKSSFFSDEIEDATGGMGYLIYQTPDAADLSGSGEEFAASAANSISNRIDEVVYRYDVEDGVVGELKKLRDRALSFLGLGGLTGANTKFNYFLGTKKYRATYQRDANTNTLSPVGDGKFTDFNFITPYITNPNNISYKTLGPVVVPDFSKGDAFDAIAEERQSTRTALDRIGLGGLGLSSTFELSGGISAKIEGASSAIRSSENVARAFYSRSDVNPNIARYEDLPSQKSDDSDSRTGLGHRANQDNEQVFYENRFDQASSDQSPERISPFGDGIVVHRGSKDGDESKSRGFPNYSQEDKKNDLIDELGVLDKEEDIDRFKSNDYNSDIYLTDDEEEFEDLIPFKIYDVENKRVLVFRAFLSSLNFNTNVQWNTEGYLGRPELFHIYSGANRSLNFSFELHPFSKEGLKAQYDKLNYLQGLTYPAGYKNLPSSGQYMVPPFTEITIGDLYNRVPGYISTFDFTAEEKSPWSLSNGKRLPEHLSVSIQYAVIEKNVPVTGQKFYDTDDETIKPRL